MKKYFLVLIILAASGCASVKEYKHSLWPQYAYPGFSEKIDRVSGDTSIDCGFYDLTSRTESIRRQRKEGFFDCVEKYTQEKAPFKFGSVRIPADSYAYEILIYSQDGEYWTITFDLMLDGSGAIHWVKRCESIKLEHQKLSYDGINCKEDSTEQWLSDIER